MGSFGTDDYYCVGLDKDHLSMVRYQSSKDPDYKLVLDLLCRLLESNGWTEHIEGRNNQAQSECSGGRIICCSYSTKGHALNGRSQYVAHSPATKVPLHLLDRTVSPFFFSRWLT